MRGIAMAQLGDLARAKLLLRRAARAFGTKEAVARARCIVAEAEIALVSRELNWPVKALDDARKTLERRGDRANAAHARYLAIRRLILIGCIDDAEKQLSGFDPTPLPPALRAAHELVVAGIALRRLRTEIQNSETCRRDRGAKGRRDATERLREHHELDERAAENLVAYLEDEKDATGALPTASATLPSSPVSVPESLAQPLLASSSEVSSLWKNASRLATE